MELPEPHNYHYLPPSERDTLEVLRHIVRKQNEELKRFRTYRKPLASLYQRIRREIHRGRVRRIEQRIEREIRVGEARLARLIELEDLDLTQQISDRVHRLAMNKILATLRA